jgi:hypothetical protein
MEYKNTYTTDEVKQLSDDEVLEIAFWQWEKIPPKEVTEEYGIVIDIAGDTPTEQEVKDNAERVVWQMVMENISLPEHRERLTWYY